MKREQITAKHTPSLVFFDDSGVVQAKSFVLKLIKLLLFYHPIMFTNVIKEWLLFMCCRTRFAAAIVDQLLMLCEAFDDEFFDEMERDNWNFGYYHSDGTLWTDEECKAIEELVLAIGGFVLFLVWSCSCGSIIQLVAAKEGKEEKDITLLDINNWVYNISSTLNK